MDRPNGYRRLLPATTSDRRVGCKVGANKCDNYIGQVYAALVKNPGWLACRNTIVAGDFNSNSIWDDACPIGNHTAVVKLLEEHGIVSVCKTFMRRFDSDPRLQFLPCILLSLNRLHQV